MSKPKYQDNGNDAKRRGKAASEKGKRYERLIAKELRKYWPEACTTRANNKLLDFKGVDIDKTSFVQVQCKATAVLTNPIPVLEKMPKVENAINVVFNKVTNKAEIVSMSKEDFYILLDIINVQLKDQIDACLTSLNALRNQLMQIPVETQGTTTTQISTYQMYPPCS